MSDFYEFDTLSLHAGQTVDKEFGARATPIYQTTSYVFPDTDTASSIFNLERGGHAISELDVEMLRSVDFDRFDVVGRHGGAGYRVGGQQ